MLKQYIFIIWCLALYITFLFSPTNFSQNFFLNFKALKAEDCLVIAFAPVLSIILTGIISSENKARIIYWRLKHALPGHRFLQLIKNDSRINEQDLFAKLDHIPKEPKAQNTLWFSLYKRYSDRITVKNSHKNFLLSRDLCTISFLFMILGPWGVFIIHNAILALLYASIMLVHYLVLMMVTRNYSNRFVCNVLVEFIYDNTS